MGERIQRGGRGEDEREIKGEKPEKRAKREEVTGASNEKKRKPHSCLRWDLVN